MNRKELLELLVASEKENTRLKEEIEGLTAQLESRELKVGQTGTMAEAAIAVNGIFEGADRAAAQYLENIRRCSEEITAERERVIEKTQQEAESIAREAEAERDRVIAKAQQEAESIAREAEAERDRVIAEAQKEAESIVEGARAEKARIIELTNDYWRSLSSTVEKYYQDHPGLKGLLFGEPGGEPGEKPAENQAENQGEKPGEK